MKKYLSLFLSIAFLFVSTGIFATTGDPILEPGSTGITTVGTITTGTWQGTQIGSAYISTSYQPLDTDLTYLAGFTPTANVKTILNAADNDAIQTALGYQTALTYPVTGVVVPTAGYLVKWGVSGNAIVDGPKLGTLTDTKWCSYTTADGLKCTEDAPAGTGDVVGPGSTTQYSIPYWSASSKTLVDGVAPGAVNALLYSNGTSWARLATSTDITSFLGSADYSTMRTNLSLSPGVNVQSYNLNLASLAGLTFADASILQLTGPATASVLTSGGNNYFLGSTSDNTALEFKTPANTLAALSTSLTSINSLTETNGGLLYGTADNAYAWLAAGGSGKLLMGAGAAAPVWTTPTFPNAATTTGAYLRADGTNFIQSTLVLPNSGTAYKLAAYTGTNVMTELAAVGGTGTVLQGVSGAIPAWSTSTYADTFAKGTVLHAGTANIITGLAPGAVGSFLMSNGTGEALTYLAPGVANYQLVGAGVTTIPVWTASTGTGSPVLSASPTLTGTPTIGTTAAGGNLTINATEGSEMAPALEDANWTMTDGWSAAGGVLTKVAGSGTGTATPSGTFTVRQGWTYKVVIVCSAVSGTLYYYLGGNVYGKRITAPTTITDYLIANSTGKIIFSGGAAITATITSVSVKEFTPETGDLTVAGNIDLKGRIKVPYQVDSSYPIIYLDGLPTTGIGIDHLGFSVAFSVWNAGVRKFALRNNILDLYSDSQILRMGVYSDVVIARDAANTLALRNSTNQQILRIYNTYSDASNYERLSLTGVQGASVNITAESAGTGSANLDVIVIPKGTGALKSATKFVHSGTPDVVSAAGAISVQTAITHVVTDGVDTVLTLAAGVEGQIKYIVLKTLTSGGQTDVITPDGGGAGFTTITMSAVGHAVSLLYTNGKWTIVGYFGATVT